MKLLTLKHEKNADIYEKLLKGFPVDIFYILNIQRKDLIEDLRKIFKYRYYRNRTYILSCHPLIYSGRINIDENTRGIYCQINYLGKKINIVSIGLNHFLNKIMPMNEIIDKCPLVDIIIPGNKIVYVKDYHFSSWVEINTLQTLTCYSMTITKNSLIRRNLNIIDYTLYNWNMLRIKNFIDKNRACLVEFTNRED